MASSVIKKQYVTGLATVTGVTVAKDNGIATATIDVTKSGYTAIGVVKISKSGTGNGGIVITAFGIKAGDANSATVGLLNPTSTDRTISVSVAVLYERSA